MEEILNTPNIDNSLKALGLEPSVFLGLDKPRQLYKLENRFRALMLIHSPNEKNEINQKALETQKAYHALKSQLEIQSNLRADLPHIRLNNPSITNVTLKNEVDNVQLKLYVERWAQRLVEDYQAIEAEVREIYFKRFSDRTEKEILAQRYDDYKSTVKFDRVFEKSNLQYYLNIHEKRLIKKIKVCLALFFLIVPLILALGYCIKLYRVRKNYNKRLNEIDGHVISQEQEEEWEKSNPIDMNNTPHEYIHSDDWYEAKHILDNYTDAIKTLKSEYEKLSSRLQEKDAQILGENGVLELMSKAIQASYLQKLLKETYIREMNVALQLGNLKSLDDIEKDSKPNRYKRVSLKPQQSKFLSTMHRPPQIERLEKDELEAWVKRIVADPAKFLLQRSWLNQNWLDECWCDATQAHSRNVPSDPRGRIENKILTAASKFNKDHALQILSLGSGELFQDFILISKFYLAGYTNINYDCIEVEDNQRQQKILNAVIDRLNKFGSNIKIRHFKSISDIPKPIQKYHIVHAIDFDDIGLANSRDFSARKLFTRGASKKSEQYECIDLLLNGFSLLIDHHHSQFILSFGETLIDLNYHHANIDAENETEQLGRVIKEETYFDYLYLNSNLIHLLFQLPFLKMRKQKLCINEKIVRNSTRDALESILLKCDIDYTIDSEQKIANKFDDENATVLIIDEAFIKNKSELTFNTILEDTNTSGYQIVGRSESDLFNRKKPRTLVTMYPSALLFMKRQHKSALNNMELLDYIRKIKMGCKSHIAWITNSANDDNENIHNVQLSIFHPWAHSVTRARKILKYLDEVKIGETKIENIQRFVDKQLIGSSSLKHSLSRYLFQSVTGNDSIEDLSYLDFAKIR